MLRSRLNGKHGFGHAFLPSVRRRLGAAASGAMKQSPGDLVDDWARPLLGAGSRAPLPTTAPPAPEAVRLRANGAHATEIDLHREAPRCLFATNSLDVNEMDEMAAFLALRLRSHGFRTAVLVVPTGTHSKPWPSSSVATARSATAS